MARNTILAMMLAASLLLAGCSNDDDGGDSAGSNPSTQTGTGGGTTGDSGAGPNTGTGTAGDGTTGEGAGTGNGTGNGTGGTTDGGTGSGSTGGGDTGTARTWRGAAVVAPGEGDLTTSHTRVDNAGNAFTVWRTSQVDMRLYVSHYVAASNTWSPPQALSANRLYQSFDAETAPNGRAIAAWTEEISLDRIALYAARYEPGTGWGPAEPVAEGAGFGNVQVATRDNGDATIAYIGAGGDGRMVMRTASAGSGFGAEQLVHDAGARVSLLDLAVGGDTRTILYDATPTTFNDDLYALRYVAGAWNGPVRLDDTAPMTRSARVVADDTGAARAFWFDAVTGMHHRYAAAGSAAWGATETIALFEVPGTSPNSANASMNIAGGVLGAREVDDKLYAAQYRAGAWSSPQVIYGDQRGYMTSVMPDIAASGAGVVQWEFAPWAGDSPDWSQYSIWANVLR